MDEFPCTKCGACCRRASNFPDFPEPTDEDGVCVHLQDDNTCGIYEDRPDVCRIKYVKRFFPDMSEEEYLEATRKMCNNFQREDRMDVSYRIRKDEL